MDWGEDEMLSLDTAQKLKDVGLEWIPKYGDMCYQKYNEGLKSEHIKLIAVVENSLTCSEIFAPRLDQLLAEIEKRGYGWDLTPVNRNSDHTRYTDYLLRIGNKNKYFHYASPEEAAAQALLWIMEQEAKACE